MQPIERMSRNRCLCTNDLVKALREGVPRIVDEGVSEDVVEAAVRASRSGRDAPLVPFASENIASQERNDFGAAVRGAELLEEGSAVGQLRLSAPDGVVDAVRGLLAGADRRVHVGDSLTFVNSKGMRTPMHSDARCGFLVHCLGKKRVVFARPELEHVSGDVLRSIRSTPGSFDDVFRSFRALPKDDRPSLARLLPECHVADLRPGDVLLIPRRWYHDVTSETATVSVSVRVEHPPGLEYEEALEGF